MAGYRGYDIEKDIFGHYELFQRGNRRSALYSSKSYDVIKRKVDELIKEQLRNLRKAQRGKMLMAGSGMRAIVNAAVQGAIAQGKVVTLNDVGEAAYLRATERAEFNSWTGNLENSYLVQVVQNGKIVKNFYNRSPKFAPRIKSKIGNEYVFLQRRRHKVRKSKRAHIFYHLKEKKYARILEPGEAKRGYIIGKGTHLSGRVSLATMAGGGNLTQAKTGIVIRNMAPYAEAVERGKAGKRRAYRVLPYGSANRLAGYGSQLAQIIIKKELEDTIKRNHLGKL